MSLRSLLAATLMLTLAACGEGHQQLAQPREPGPGSIGHYCRMTLAEHKGPKGQILPKGWEEPLWFTSVRDALTYVEQDIVSERELAGFWVNDMAQGTWDTPGPGSWITAQSAWYVLGSSKSSGMGGSEAVPFKNRAAAEAFAKEFGGHIADYPEARREMAEAPAPGTTDGEGS